MSISDADPESYAIEAIATIPKRMLLAWLSGWLMGVVEMHLAGQMDDVDLRWALEVARVVRARANPDA